MSKSRQPKTQDSDELEVELVTKPEDSVILITVGPSGADISIDYSIEGATHLAKLLALLVTGKLNEHIRNELGASDPSFGAYIWDTVEKVIDGDAVSPLDVLNSNLIED